MRVAAVLLVMALGASACTRTSQVSVPADPEQAKLHARGKVVYQSSCTACHHSDPTKPGALGPEVFGSSRELLEARVIHGKYPEGYTPKRATGSMVALPHLKADIEALTVYLNKLAPQPSGTD